MRSTRWIAAALALLAATAAPAAAQAPQSPLDPLLHGALVFHGNYCGPGNKGADPAPVDALDAACMHHDACVKDFELPSCGCNERLAKEAMAVAMDPGAPADERQAASFTSEGAAQLPCQH